MTPIDPRAFEFALSRIRDGFLFEKFIDHFLAAVLGYEFIPVGGLKDRGIDGLEHCFTRTNFERYIYQTSTEEHPFNKLEDTLAKLLGNKIPHEKLYFVTSQVFPDKDKAIDELYEKYKIPITIYDAHWLSAQVNTTPGTIAAYNTFITSSLHEFEQPGKVYVVDDLVQDPRLYVFLRQQWDTERRDLQLDVILADTLILYELEGTDPDKGIFKVADQIKGDIRKHIHFDPKLLYSTIDRRLTVLAKGADRQIQYHKSKNAFCLPYRTRLEIQERNFKDAALHQSFLRSVEQRLRTFLKDADIQVKDCVRLIEATIHSLFHTQGLEFSNFVLKGDNREAVEKQLPDIISATVDRSAVVLKNKNAVKTALLITIRDLVYSGSQDEKHFLSRLSNTYMMLFLLQCDPKLATFFARLASSLNVYVCTSILIPAMSEYFLEPENRRYSSLLRGARAAGVSLIINRTILEELANHFRKISNKYRQDYAGAEHLYMDNEARSLLVEEIMIRAYFYARARNKTSSFEDFLDAFVSPSLENPEAELETWLKEEFGVEFRSDASLGVTINEDELNKLYEELLATKRNELKAMSDAMLILTIHAVREKNNESDKSGIFGYRTWWLSSDSLTQRAVDKVFGNKYRISCYLRPDFLNNYISLAPMRPQVDAAYSNLFPSLLGVNLSVHLPKDVIDIVHKKMNEHRGKNPTRLSAIMKDLVERLKVTPPNQARQTVEHFLDDQLRQLPGAERST